MYLDHRLEVVRRRSEYDLARARERAHILEGLLVALDHLDEVIDIIRRSRTVDSAHANLRKHFKLSDEQAEAILQMQLRRLAALERRKLEDEYKEKMQLIKMLDALLQSPKMMRMEIARELTDIRDKYSDPRRTVILSGPIGNIQEGDFLGPRTDQWVTVTEGGLVSRTHEDGAPRITTEMKDPPLAMMASNSTHTLYLFTANGDGATIPVNVLQQTDDPEQGARYTTVCPLPPEAEITTAISLPPELDSGYLAMITEQGEVKRLRLEDLPGLTANIINLMDVEKGDRLIWLGWVDDDSEIILATQAGMAIRFKVAEVRPTGLGAGGMRAVKLKDAKDRVGGAAVVDENANFWTCTDTGVAKSTPIGEYPVQGRAGQGVMTMKLPSDAKGLAVATLGRPDDNIVLVTNRGKPKYMRIGLAPVAKRSYKGDYVISLKEKEVAVRVVKLLDRLDVPAAQTIEDDDSSE